MHIVVAGGTGFIGSHLVRTLTREGHTVTLVSRKPKAGDPSAISWDQLKASGLPSKTDAVIQLAGHSILNIPRWTAGHKELVLRSRVETGEALLEAMKKAPPQVYIAASAVGIYQINNAEKYTEEKATLGSDFPAQVCQEVEKICDLAAKHVERVVKMRTGVVLGKTGGALQRMWLPFKFGLGGTIGLQGSQSFPWIHIEDMVGLYLHALNNPAVRGPLNGTAPQHTTNYEFTKALGKALWRPAVLPVPGFVLRTLMGEESTLLLDGQNVYPEKALQTGFQFRFPGIEQALTDIRDSTEY